MNIISTFGERIIELRKIKGISLAEMSKTIKERSHKSITAQALNRYELGQREAKINIAHIVAEAYGVNPLWMCGYDAEMYIHKTEYNISDFPVSSDEKRLVEYYRGFSEEDKKEFIGIALLKYQKNLANEKCESTA